MSNAALLPPASAGSDADLEGPPRPAASLRRNVAWTFAGNVVYAACQWGMLVVLAKLGELDAVGTFCAGLMWTGPAFMLAGLNLRALQASDARHEFAFGHYLALRLVMSALTITAVAAIAALRYDGPARIVILAITLAKGIEWTADIFYGLLQQNERMRWIAVSMMLKGALSVLALAAGFLLGGLWLGAALMAVVGAGVLVTYDLPNALTLLDSGAWPRWDAGVLRRLFVQALPLGVVLFLISLQTNLPRFALEDAWGEGALGVFAALSYVMVAGTTVVNAVGQSATPKLSRLAVAQDRTGFLSLLGKLLLLGAALGVAGVAIAALGGGPLLSLLYRPEYAEHLAAFVWLMAAAGVGFVGSFLGYGLTAARVLRAQAPLFAAVCAAAALGSTLWVPIHGLTGGAWALLLAAVVQVMGSAALLAVALRRWRTS